MVTTSKASVPNAGAIISDIELISAADARPTPLISGRGPTIVVILPVGGGDNVEEYLGAHMAQARHLAEWGARLVTVVTGSALEAESTVPPSSSGQFVVLADPWRRLGTAGPAVLVVDEWGEVFFATQTEHVEDLPTPKALQEWAVFVAIQCPECEGPERGWKDLSARP